MGNVADASLLSESVETGHVSRGDGAGEEKHFVKTLSLYMCDAVRSQIAVISYKDRLHLPVIIGKNSGEKLRCYVMFRSTGAFSRRMSVTPSDNPCPARRVRSPRCASRHARANDECPARSLRVPAVDHRTRLRRRRSCCRATPKKKSSRNSSIPSPHIVSSEGVPLQGVSHPSSDSDRLVVGPSGVHVVITVRRGFIP